MSLNAALRTATSGLNAAQMGLRAVSDNIANVNTPGYVRKTVEQAPLVVAGQGMGVSVTGTKRITDQYLELASQTASGEASRWGAYSQYIDTAQGLFGDPTSENFFFNRLDTLYSGFSAAANDPSSTLLRSQAVANVKDFLGEAQRINSQLVSLSETMDTRISADIAEVNALLSRINSLNGDIVRAKLIEQDASGAENIQAQLVNQLSGLMGVKVSPHAGGGVDIRSGDGLKLAGDGAVTLTYNSSPGNPGYITATADGGAPQPLQLDSGEVRGLLDLRNTELPQLSDQLGELVQGTVDQLNAAHNASSTVPAPTTLTGRSTGLDLTSAVSGFTGQTTVALTDSSGVVQHQVAIDFDAMTMSVNGGAATAFGASTFDADLNAALGGLGTASFTNGALKISGAGGLGVAIDEGTSLKAGKAFSHFFGLNDLVRSSGTGTYATGLTGTSAHGFTPGDTITLRLSQPDGKALQDVTVTVPASPTMDDLVAALNNTSNGVGLYGAFSLDTQGRLSFTGAPPTNAVLSVVSDKTAHVDTGIAMTQLFGLGAGERSSRANQFKVDAVVAADPGKLAFAHLDLDVAAGAPALRIGDARGALALAESGDVNAQFGAAGGLGTVNMTVARYASEFSGAIARGAADAQSRTDAAESVKTEAEARRQSAESVNLDEELVNLTTYQQAFNASARMIQAVKELFDVLTNII
ncbi:flagellar hook-associated protein FlgK [Phenylobacterium sp. LjRoot225]|uniref:flagellar hook-associated protein FlgK n=1 Tax=Phenylobacterium sp. LjRoot225 TaxID=3342285 RepID=UPI003ED02024